MQISLDTAKSIYRDTITSSARDGEGADWRSEVAGEVREVIAARTLEEVAQVIAWWPHHDWEQVSDTSRAAAERIRRAARQGIGTRREFDHLRKADERNR
ncbi:hypothetical protein [Burkholderia gladioli]|uniref:hypothetical protein n=1 Tax=Burkholderia gladioli TaxID=28095 RepID=UPI0009B88FC8|nr:hypothetical protein [Burkholderia gladioli]